ncbi:MAG: methionine--tRNA ligase, partial [Candidatus Kapabacteria bacterium]|nr:methionine--tRNA ligase [Candidatus Kapabacteria bacterium]
RQILAGIAQHYSPEQLVGTTIVVVANLKPATLMGLESQGMVLAASNASGALSLVRPSDAPIGPGGLVK